MQHAKELSLEIDRDLSYLVQEQGAAVRRFEASDAITERAGECALRVPEELALVELAGNRRAVHPDERLARPPAPAMNGLGDELLARARFARDQDGGVGGGHQVDLPLHVVDGRARADDGGELVVRRHDLSEVLVLSLQSPLQAGDLVERAGARDRGRRMVGQHPKDVDRRLGEADTYEDPQHAEHVLSVEERLSPEALNVLIADPVRAGHVRIRRRVRHDDGSALRDHRADLEGANGDAAEGAHQLSIELHRATAGTQGARREMKTLLAGEAHVRIAADGARIAWPEQPDAGERDALGALGHPADDERKERSEFAFLRDLEQEIFQRFERRGSRFREEHPSESSPTIRDHRESSNGKTQDFAITTTSTSSLSFKWKRSIHSNGHFLETLQAAATTGKHARHPSTPRAFERGPWTGPCVGKSKRSQERRS